MIHPQLENKVALITGANHGIGAADSLIHHIRAQGGAVVAHEADLSMSDNIRHHSAPRLKGVHSSRPARDQAHYPS